MAPEFIGLGPGQHAESDVPRFEQLDPYFAGNTSQRGGRMDDT
jgi:hypothetical protein